MGGANQTISAGLGGFFALFLLALVLWLLMRNMSGRLRNVRFEEEVEDERRVAEAGEDVSARPSRRQIFLPVDPDYRPTFAEEGPRSAYGPATWRDAETGELVHEDAPGADAPDSPAPHEDPRP